MKEDLEQLNQVSKSLHNITIPTAKNLRNQVCSEIKQIQLENILLSRSNYLSLYSIFFHLHNDTLLQHDELMRYVYVHKNIDIETIDTLSTQILVKIIKQLFEDPMQYAKMIVSTCSNFSNQQFAFSTFPSLYGFFTSEDMCQNAAALLVSLIKIKAPESILEPMITSYLFSLNSFLNTLWDNFFLSLCNYSAINDKLILEEIVIAIKKTLPLISESHYLVIRELINSDADFKCKVIIMNFLFISFLLWLESDKAKLFQFVYETQNFFLYLQNSPEKMNSIISSFMENMGRIDYLPSYIVNYGLSHETLVFSIVDICVLTKAFSDCSTNILLSCSRTKISVTNPFQPFMVDLYLPLEPKKLDYLNLFDISSIPKISFEFNSSYEYIYSYLNKENINSKIITDPKFLKYAKKKEIIKLNELFEAQEDFFTLKYYLNICKNLKYNIKQFRYVIFSKYIQEMLKNYKFKSKKFTNIVNELLLNSVYKTSFILKIYTCLFNMINIKSLFKNTTFITSFQTLLHKLKKNKINYPIIHYSLLTKQLLFHIGSTLNNENFGNMFVILTNVFNEIRTISEHFYKKENIELMISSTIKSIILLSDYQELIHVFLFFEKFAFREANFFRRLNYKEFNNWNYFFQAFWELMSNDNIFIKQCLEFNININKIVFNK